MTEWDYNAQLNRHRNSSIVVPNDDEVIRSIQLFGGLTLLSLCVYSILNVHCTAYFRPRLWSEQQARGEVVGSVARNWQERGLEYIAWIRSAVFEFRSDEDLVERVGLDAFLTIRLTGFCAWLCVCFSVVGMLILVPTYASRPIPDSCVDYCKHGGLSPDDPAKFSSTCVCGKMDRLSLASLQPGSQLLWLPCIAMIVLSLFTLYSLDCEYKYQSAIRQSFWKRRPAQLYTVMLNHLPPALRNKEDLQQYFETLFPGKVERVCVVGAERELIMISEERRKVLTELERALAKRSRQSRVDTATGYRPHVHVEGSANGFTPGEPVHWELSCSRKHGIWRRCASIPTLTRRLENLNKRFSEVKLKLESNSSGIAGFVTFNTVFAATVAYQCQVSGTSSDLNVKPAPGPTDIQWSNLGVNPFSSQSRKLVVRVLTMFLVVFFGALTSLVGAATSTEELMEFEPVRNFIRDHPGSVMILDQIAPFVLVLLLSLVNPILFWLANVEGTTTWSKMEHRVTTRYFAFLVVQVFLFYGVSGTVFKTLGNIAERPKFLVSTLASNIPKNSNFYIQFIVIRLFSALSTDLLRLSSLSFGCLRVMCCRKDLTEYERETTRCGIHAPTYPAPCNLSSINGQTLLLFFIAISYCTIQPFILVAAVVYFALSYLVNYTLFTSATRQLYDSGGTLWPSAFWCLVSALFVGQLTLVGLLLLMKAFIVASVLFLVVPVTAISAYVIDHRNRRVCTNMSLDIARDLDNDVECNRQGNPVVRCVPTPQLWHGVLFTPATRHDNLHSTGEFSEESNIGFTSNNQFGPAGYYSYKHPVMHEDGRVAAFQGMYSDELNSYTPLLGESEEELEQRSGDDSSSALLVL